MSDNRDLYQRAQRALVCSIIADPENTYKVLEIVHEDDIEDHTLATVFSTAAELQRRSLPISIISVAELLQERGRLAEVGGVVALHQIHDQGKRYLHDATPEIYARIVKEGSAKAKLGRTISDSLKLFKDDSGVSTVSAAGELRQAIDDVTARLSNNNKISVFNESLDDYERVLAERERIREENKDKLNGLMGIPSLLAGLDRYTTGWNAGQLVTVGAGTGVGKSVFALNCALAAAQAGKTVLFFSLEMERDELFDRIIAAHTGIPQTALKKGDLSDEQKALYNEKRDELLQLNIVIDTEAGVSTDSIKAKAIKQSSMPSGLDFIIIDYLQLVKPSNEKLDRQQQVASMSGSMKNLARELGIPIMALVQLNRKREDEEEDTLPTLDKIRESHAIAQDSDIIVLLHRTKTKDDTLPPTYVILEKNRNGPAQKIIRCHSNLACAIFSEMSKEETEKLDPKGIEEDSLPKKLESGEPTFDDEGEDIFGDVFSESSDEMIDGW